MNLYFSCSLTGGRRDEAIYAVIVDHLLGGGHMVPTAHLARPEVMSLEWTVDPKDVYRRDTGWIQECDAIIAEVSTPSHGVGYEIAYGLALGKPVLCLHHQEVAVSKMLTGNDSEGFVISHYRDARDALETIDGFLSGVRTSFGPLVS